MSFSKQLQARVRAAQREQERKLGARVEALRNVPLEELVREAHKVRGGFAQHRTLTVLAGEVEGAARAGEGDRARVALEALIEEARRISALPDLEAPPSEGPASNASAPRAGRILIADDDDAIRRMTKLVLERVGGYEVVALPSGEGVLKLLEDESFDLLIADAMMPGTSGIELCAALADSDLPVAVLSAASPEELGTEPTCRWWRKPLSADELLERVAECMDG
ncbi:MAG: response regulator [Myxococcota bacterium]